MVLPDALPVNDPVDDAEDDAAIVPVGVTVGATASVVDAAYEVSAFGYAPLPVTFGSVRLPVVPSYFMKLTEDPLQMCHPGSAGAAPNIANVSE